MKSLLRKNWYFTVIALLLFASAGLAAPQDTITFAGGGINPGVGPALVNPYYAYINGSSSLSEVICDDFSNEVYVGESWTAYVTPMSSLTSTTVGPPPMFGATPSTPLAGTPSVPALTQQQLYDALAYLGNNILASAGNIPALTADTYAIWELTCATGIGSCAGQPFGYLPGATLTAAQNKLTAALANDTPSQGVGWEILTADMSDPVTCKGSGCPSPNNAAALGVPQEFLVRTPESSSGILLGSDILGVLALAFFFRKRLFSPAS